MICKESVINKQDITEKTQSTHIKIDLQNQTNKR